VTGRLAGKAALVVGGGSRFGQAVAAVLGREGAQVAVGCSDEASGCAAVALIAAAGGRAQHVLLDPTDAASCAAAVERTLAAFGRLDVLVTRVVLPPRERKPLHEITVEEWLDTVTHAVDAAALPVWHAQQAMAARGGGSIVVVSSSAALVGVPGTAALSAAGGALVNFARGVALGAWRQRVPVRVNCLALGLPPAPPEEVAPLVVFLASDDSKRVNGQVIPVDDGLTAWRD
jgi:NAD(P)-dependent dehydrogenase (short-subunit alcohol dehydrogenase family)